VRADRLVVSLFGQAMADGTFCGLGNKDGGLELRLDPHSQIDLPSAHQSHACLFAFEGPESDLNLHLETSCSC
jgi:hypothetical protein